MTNQQLQQRPQQKFSVAIQGEGYKKLIANTLTDPGRAQRFVAAVSSAVATNPALQECEPGSVLSSALLGEALGLSPSPQLGQYYMVPFNKKGKNGDPDTKVAQFQLGYKGYIQLATRSGFYKKLNVLAVKKGELIKCDPLNEEYEIQLIEDDEERELTETIGYYAMFEYPNGFRKPIYWSKKKMLNHADKYSQAFNKEIYLKLQAGEKVQDAWKYSSFWYKSFDDMAFKTMLRHLISRWGVMSIEMTDAYTKDMSELKANGEYDYIDSTSTVAQEPVQQEPIILPELSAEEFAAVRTELYEVVASGKKKPAQIIATLKTKNTLTDEQIAEINLWSDQ